MSKEFWKNTAIRAVKTFCQSLVAAIGVGAAVSEVDWLNALSVALVAGLVSVLTSLASLDTVCEPSDNIDEDDTDDSEVGANPKEELSMATKTNTGLVAYAKAQVGLPYWYGTYVQTASSSLLSARKK